MERWMNSNATMDLAFLWSSGFSLQDSLWGTVWDELKWFASNSSLAPKNRVRSVGAVPNSAAVFFSVSVALLYIFCWSLAGQTTAAADELHYALSTDPALLGSESTSAVRGENIYISVDNIFLLPPSACSPIIRMGGGKVSKRHGSANKMQANWQ